MIDIKTIAVPKKSNNGGTSTTIIKSGGGSSSSGSKFDPHYLWGQYFDDTEDINGDLTGVGSITAKGEIGTEGNIRGDTIFAKKVEVEEGISVDNLDVNTLNAEDVNATNVNADVTNTTKLEVGDKEKGQWIIEEDENVDLHVHIPQDETFRVRPNDVDVFNVNQNKVHISTKLDLTNSDDGTNVSMGKSVNDKKNTNIKSIVEEGFYFTDSENNVAIGIGNNYIQMGIDIGSPNFISGSKGWRVQPDGTAEFQNLKVDGNLDVYVITYNEMRATNGILLVTDVGCITDVIDNTIGDNKYWIFTISEFPPFAIDDYVLLQYKVDETRILSFKGIVTAVNEDGKNTVRVLCLSGFEGEGTSNDDRGATTFRTVDPETANGQYLIRIGNKSDANRQTIIKLNPYDGGYIDFMKGLNNENILASEDNIKGKLPTACRIGNLSGVTYKGTTLEGYGLYADNAYLTGAIKNLENTWSLNEDGSGNVAGNHITWDKDGNLKIMLGDNELNSYISEIYNELDGKITTTKTELSAEITASAEALTSDYNKKITDTTTDLEGKINTTKTELEGEITQTAESLTSDYTKKITDTESDINGKINTKVSELEGEISQSAESLQSDYNQKITDVDGKITTAESNFTQTANGISSRVKTIEDDYITSSELNVAADSISSRVTAIENDYVTTSTLTQTANGLSSRVSAIENDYVTSSEIAQSSDSVKLSVFNDLKQRTGIDVQAGKIIMNADNTEFTGNIQLKKANDVLTVLDSNGSTVININNGSVSSTPQVQQNLINLSQQYGKYSYGESINPYSFHYTNTITGYNIGTFTTSDSIQFKDYMFSIRVASTNYDNGVYDFPSYNYNDGGTYSMTVKFYQKSGSTTYTLHTQTASNKRHFDNATFSPSINGVVYADFTFDFNPNRTKMTNFNMNLFITEALSFYIYKYPVNLTTIGKNGISVINSSNSFLTKTDSSFKVVEGNYSIDGSATNGFRTSVVPDFSSIYTPTPYYAPIGVPIYINLSSPSLLKDITVYNEDGSSTTVKGFEVNAKVLSMIHITGSSWANNTNYFIILPYAEGAMVHIKNSSSKTFYIYARGASTSQNKNIYYNQHIPTTRNQGRLYLDLGGNNAHVLTMYATRNGWFNMLPLGS